MAGTANIYDLSRGKGPKAARQDLQGERLKERLKSKNRNVKGRTQKSALQLTTTIDQYSRMNVKTTAASIVVIVNGRAGFLGLPISLKI